MELNKYCTSKNNQIILASISFDSWQEKYLFKINFVLLQIA